MTGKNRFSRKDFLNLSGLGLVSLLGRQLTPISNLLSGQQGRVISDHIYAYSQPSFESDKLRIHWKDEVFPIGRVVLGAEEPEHNRIWYKISEGGLIDTDQTVFFDRLF